MSQHVFELNQSVNNRQVSFKVGKSIIEYSQIAFSNNYYPILSITIDDEHYSLIRETVSTKFDNCFGPTQVNYQSDKCIEIFMNNSTGACTIKGYGDHTVKIEGMEMCKNITSPCNIIPEKSVIFEW